MTNCLHYIKFFIEIVIRHSGHNKHLMEAVKKSLFSCFRRVFLSNSLYPASLGNSFCESKILENKYGFSDDAVGYIKFCVFYEYIY